MKDNYKKHFFEKNNQDSLSTFDELNYLSESYLSLIYTLKQERFVKSKEVNNRFMLNSLFENIVLLAEETFKCVLFVSNRTAGAAVRMIFEKYICAVLLLENKNDEYAQKLFAYTLSMKNHSVNIDFDKYINDIVGLFPNLSLDKKKINNQFYWCKDILNKEKVNYSILCSHIDDNHKQYTLMGNTYGIYDRLCDYTHNSDITTTVNSNDSKVFLLSVVSECLKLLINNKFYNEQLNFFDIYDKLFTKIYKDIDYVLNN